MSDTARVRLGQLLSIVTILLLLADAGVTLLAPGMMHAEMQRNHLPEDRMPLIGAIGLACVVLYAIPRTAVLGAVLVSGFLGGAICTHMWLGEVGSPPQLACLAIGLAAWGGLFLRDPRLRALLPVRA